MALILVTARKRSLGQGNVFTPVSHSDHRGVGVYPIMHLGRGCISQHVLHDALGRAYVAEGGGVHPQIEASLPNQGQPPKGVVRTLLECILVFG